MTQHYSNPERANDPQDSEPEPLPCARVNVFGFELAEPVICAHDGISLHEAPGETCKLFPRICGHHTPSATELPPCVLAMQCYCAGHARGNPASAACDTTE